MATTSLSPGAIEALIDAAIDCEVLHSPGTSDFLKQGGYYVFTNVSGGGSMILPGRGAPAPSIPDYSNAEALDPGSFSVNGQPASELYAKWEQRINELFYPFQTMPFPEDFSPVFDSFDPVLRLMAVDPGMFPNTAGDGEDPLDLDAIGGGNDHFSLVSSASTEFALFQGLTSDAFRKYFLDRFPLVTQRQFAILLQLKASVAAEQELWRHLHEDVRSLVGNATSAFESNGGGGGGGGTPDFAVPLAILGAAALVPQLALAAGVASAGIGILSVLPDTGGEKWDYDFDTVGAEEIWHKLTGHVDKLKSLAREQEQAMSTQMGNVSSLLAGDPGKFDLSVIDDPTDADTTSESDEVQQSTDASDMIGVLDINVDVAHQTGEDLKFVAKDFHTAAGALNGLLGSSGTWSRSGEIGMGYIGHFEATAELADTLCVTLRNTGQGLERAGESIQVAVTRINDGDVAADAAMRALRSRVEAAEGREATIEAGSPGYA